MSYISYSTAIHRWSTIHFCPRCTFVLCLRCPGCTDTLIPKSLTILTIILNSLAILWFFRVCKNGGLSCTVLLGIACKLGGAGLHCRLQLVCLHRRRQPGIYDQSIGCAIHCQQYQIDVENPYKQHRPISCQ